MMEFGERDNHVDDDGEIIARDTIKRCMDEAGNKTYRIILDGNKVGGVILKIDKETNHNHLELFFVLPDEHSKGIGFGAWQAVEALHPETKVWETYTPYFEKRNIHFYVNKCGFHIVEFYNEYNVDPNMPQEHTHPDEGPDEMFRFIKVMQ
ncbi:MAG: GNAT family N-acetyltransferase [Angelakisella sp.]|nr:GNAT family N-acetyltransferase [Angelakisella sp.]